MEAEVERVQDEAAARDPEVRLVVLVVVPAERRNAVAARESCLFERDRELPRAAHRVAVRGAVKALVGHPRDDLGVVELVKAGWRVPVTTRRGSRVQPVTTTFRKMAVAGNALRSTRPASSSDRGAHRFAWSVMLRWGIGVGSQLRRS